jgi:hypothetical protein
LRAVGLSLTRIVPTNSLYSTTEAVVTYAGNLTRREENHLPFAICHLPFFIDVSRKRSGQPRLLHF